MDNLKRGINMKGLLISLILLCVGTISLADDYRIVPPVPVITNGVMTGTNVLTSIAIDIHSLAGALIYCSFTGTPNGTFSVQASLTGTSGTFIDTGITVSAAVGSAGSRMVDLNPTSINFVRIVYTNTSSTGVLNCVESAKTF